MIGCREPVASISAWLTTVMLILRDDPKGGCLLPVVEKAAETAMADEPAPFFAPTPWLRVAAVAAPLPPDDFNPVEERAAEMLALPCPECVSDD